MSKLMQNVGICHGDLKFPRRILYIKQIMHKVCTISFQNIDVFLTYPHSYLILKC